MAKKDILVYANPSYQANLLTITWYEQSVGLLIYTITETWFDIAFAFSTLSQFANNPCLEHIKRTFQYFRKYPNLEIIHTKSKAFTLHGYVDFDWAINPITQRLTTGFHFILAGDVIIASSKRQHLVTLSSTKAEYIAYCQATKRQFGFNSY